MEPPLKKGTLKCPCCKEPLHFEIRFGMRIIRDGTYNAKCPKKGTHYTVISPKEKTK